MWRWSRRALAALVFMQVLGVGATVWAYPVLGAAACPACFGFEHVSSGLVVDRGMSATRRRMAVDDLAAARARVRATLGMEARRFVVVGCSSGACDRRMGGLGARATVYSTPLGSVVRVAPDGLDRTILTHELAHVALHRLVGVRAQLSGALPAWFDEGIAVIVSDDPRYLGPGEGPVRCTEPFSPALPRSPLEWAPLSGLQHETMYPSAACGVLEWMAANDDWPGLRRALDDLAAGRRRALP